MAFTLRVLSQITRAGKIWAVVWRSDCIYRLGLIYYLTKICQSDRSTNKRYFWWWWWLFDYVPVNYLSVMSGRVFLGWTSTKQGLMCLAQGHNPVMLVRLEPGALHSPVKHSTTEPPRSQEIFLDYFLGKGKPLCWNSYTFILVENEKHYLEIHSPIWRLWYNKWDLVYGLRSGV